MQYYPYLSNAVKELIRSYLHETCCLYYLPLIEFLKECSIGWQKTTSEDGRITLSPYIYESEDKRLRVEHQINKVVISYNGRPIVTENRWLNLIQKANDLITILPNSVFTVNNDIVNSLDSIVPARAILYKGILELCPSTMVDELTYKVLQTADIPTQEDLYGKHNCTPINEYYFVNKICPQSIPTTQNSPQSNLDTIDLEILENLLSQGNR